MTWPIVEGVSLMHLHVNRGKRSVVVDLRTDEGVELFLDLVRESDVVVEAMRPGGLARRGLTFERMREINPRIVQCTISGYGATGPYRDLASHGIAYDAWAGIFTPETDANGHPGIPDHVSIGINAGPLFGALGILAAVIHARATGEGSELELAQSDAAAAFDWYRGETYRAYERPESEVTGNKSDDYVRREPAIAGMRGGVRYQVYASSDGYVLFMASEQHFWKKFTDAVERPELFERWPGSQYGDHARGNTEMQTELTSIFAHAQHGGVGAVRHRRRRTDRAGQHAAHTARRPAVPRPDDMVPGGRAGCGSAPVPGQGGGGGAARSGQGARGRRAHRRRPRATSSATTTRRSPPSATPAPSPDPKEATPPGFGVARVRIPHLCDAKIDGR